MIALNRICVVSVSQASISSDFGGDPNLELLNEETFYRGKSDTKRSVASNQSKNTLGVSVKRYVMKKQRDFLQEENIRMA